MRARVYQISVSLREVAVICGVSDLFRFWHAVAQLDEPPFVSDAHSSINLRGGSRVTVRSARIFNALSRPTPSLSLVPLDPREANALKRAARSRENVDANTEHPMI